MFSFGGRKIIREMTQKSKACNHAKIEFRKINYCKTGTGLNVYYFLNEKTGTLMYLMYNTKIIDTLMIVPIYFICIRNKLLITFNF